MKNVKLPHTLYRRDRYLDQIRPFINQSLIKVLSGQRRVGKSYLLFQIMQELQEQNKTANLIYINKEDLAFDAITNAQELNDYVLSQSVEVGMGKNYIFIDEVQDIHEFEKALRSLLLDHNNDIYISGNNATMLSGELATYLSGRYIEFTIYSLSYAEFLQFHRLADSDKHMLQYFKYGGLPYLINLTLSYQVFEYLKSIYATIVFRDVINRNNIRNTVLLEQIIAFMADNIGGLFSTTRISNALKSRQINVAPNQIQLYTQYLINSFLIHDVNRYDMLEKRILEVGSKYYFEDLGIRNAIIGYKLDDMDKILENVVYNHLLICGWKVKTGILQGKEIDFVCTKNKETLYIQVALRLMEVKTITLEYGNLEAIKDNYPKWMVTNEQFNGNTHKGIQHVYIRDFLLKTF